MKRIIRWLPLVVLSVMLLSVQLGCEKNPSEYTDSNVQIKAMVGEEFKLVLDSNQTTGYSWRISVPLDTKIVGFKDVKYEGGKSGRIGEGGQETWTFKTTGKGTTRIFFEYIRPWEEGKKPAKTQTFKLEVD